MPGTSEFTMGNLVYRFGRCELDVDTRELRVDGRLRALEPRPFSLLVYLLRERHRVVRKDELIDEIWPDRIVSVGALARAVCCLRKAIDEGPEPMVQTLHRVGFRFVGPVHESRPAAHPRPGSAPPVVALLPPEDATGESESGWSAAGLAATVGHGLAALGCAWPFPLRSLRAVLQSLPAFSEPAAIAEALRARHEVDVLIHTRMTREKAGYRLDCSLFGAGPRQQFTLRAEDPLRLGRKLTRQLPKHLNPLGAETPQAQADDHWVLELFAHAVEASMQGNRSLARKFCLAVLEYEPHFAEAVAELEYLDTADR
ncbi:winged helix-turn-helix domain-containing protein [Ideonella sp. YS5]|uniref:winged helix-turn-helix domain-containing protein n=1 Tax=Ideonella sp. YS5 TaxID=3453714 RepID=UPI003EEDDE4F